MAFYSESTRRPWNNVIFPGNQVCHLNAYRNQGVQAIPGVNFFRIVGAALLDSDAAATATPYELKILSPDLRQDDKPRLDRAFILPAGAVVYRTAVNVENLSSGAAETISVTGGVTPAATLTADGGGAFSDGGAFTGFDLSDALTALVSDTAVTATASGNLTVVDKGSCSAIIVEVCFYMDAPAPDSADLHLPYKTETGQSSY